MTEDGERTKAWPGLIGGVEPREVVMTEYDPAWPRAFEAVRRERSLQRA